jgi:hypothetical protein
MMMNWKGFGSKRSWPNFMEFAWRYCGIPRKTTIKKDGRRGRESNPGPPEYEEECQPLDYNVRSLLCRHPLW